MWWWKILIYFKHFWEIPKEKISKNWALCQKCFSNNVFLSFKKQNLIEVPAAQSYTCHKPKHVKILDPISFSFYGKLSIGKSKVLFSVFSTSKIIFYHLISVFFCSYFYSSNMQYYGEPLPLLLFLYKLTNV